MPKIGNNITTVLARRLYKFNIKSKKIIFIKYLEAILAKENSDLYFFILPLLIFREPVLEYRFRMMYMAQLMLSIKSSKCGILMIRFISESTCQHLIPRIKKVKSFILFLDAFCVILPVIVFNRTSKCPRNHPS